MATRGVRGRGGRRASGPPGGRPRPGASPAATVPPRPVTSAATRASPSPAPAACPALGVRVQPGEPVEDPLAVRLRDSRAVVLDEEPHRASRRQHPHLHDGPRVPERVAEQVVEHQPDLARARRHDGRRGRDQLHHGPVPVLPPDRRARRRHQVDRAGRRPLAGVRPGQREQVGEQRGEALGLHRDGAQRLLVQRRVGVYEGDLGLRADGGHRGPQLVRRVAGEPLQPRHRVVAPGQQPVEFRGQGAQLVVGRRHGQSVAGRQRRGGRSQPVDRPQRRPRRHPRRPGDDQRREQCADHREPRGPPHQRRPAHEVGRRHGQPRGAVRGDRDSSRPTGAVRRTAGWSLPHPRPAERPAPDRAATADPRPRPARPCRRPAPLARRSPRSRAGRRPARACVRSSWSVASTSSPNASAVASRLSASRATRATAPTVSVIRTRSVRRAHQFRAARRTFTRTRPGSRARGRCARRRPHPRRRACAAGSRRRPRRRCGSRPARHPTPAAAARPS